MARTKPPKLGNVWPIAARLFRNGKQVGTCMDTPNAIAKALMEYPQIDSVKPFGCSVVPRDAYAKRMANWNEAESHAVVSI